MTTPDRQRGLPKDRVKRPVLDRSGPIRGWPSAVSPGAQPPSEESDPAAPPPDDRDPIVRGVLSGGRVVDEWIRQAQQTARLVGGAAPTAAWADTSARMFKAASDIMGAWWSMVGMTPPNGAGTWPGPRPTGQAAHESAWQAKPWTDPAHSPESSSNGAGHSEASAVSPGAKVKLEVSSRRPVEVTIDLHRPRRGPLRVLDLRAEKGSARRIKGTEFESSGVDGLRLRLVVPDDQPPGSYHAVIVDPVADCAVGTVTLKIPE
jgi:hypothetical protein